MYIDENCFLPLKMREGYPIEANFLVLVPNRGFTLGQLSGMLLLSRRVGSGKF